MSNPKTDLYNSLTKYWQEVVDELVASLYKVNRVASGVTAQSIGDLNSKPITLSASGFKVQIAMPDYYQFIDEGISGAKYNRGISRFKYTDKMPPISAIRKFMLNRGINPIKKSNTRLGKKRNNEAIRNGLAFVIAKSIYEKGIEPTHFYSNVINDKKLLNFEAQLLTQYRKYIIDLV